jgi:hypothetical protein
MLYGQDIKVTHLMRVHLNIVGRRKAALSGEKEWHGFYTTSPMQT